MQAILTTKTTNQSENIHSHKPTFRPYPCLVLTLLMVILCCLQASLPAQIIINEVYPLPKPGEPEWVECYNSSTTTITVVNLILQDKARNKAILEQLTIPPQSFCVLTRDTMLYRKSPFSDPITRLVQVPTLPIFNNDSDSIILIDGSRIIDTFSYYSTRNAPSGISFERKDEYSPASYPNNVQLSIDSRGSTPGRVNSIALSNYDLFFRSINFDAAQKRFSVLIENVGRLPLSDGVVALYLDTVPHILTKLSNQIFMSNIVNITRGRHFISTQEFTPPDVPSLFCMGIIRSLEDERPENDTLRTIVYIPLQPETIRINEIFAEPKQTPDGHDAEWIEIYNSYHRPINLYSWFLNDARGDTLIFSSHFIINAHSLGIICFDSAFFRQHPNLQGLPNVYCFPRSTFTLNNDIDVFRLYDPRGTLHDSVTYYSHWHDASLESTRGRSLEKRSPLLASSLPSSWSSSGATSGSTPLLPNSLQDNSNSTLRVEITPSPFRRTLLEFCTLRYFLPFAPARLTIKVFNSLGHWVGDLLHFTYSGASGSINWDGRINNQTLQPGGYILFFEVVNPLNGDVCSLKQFLVIS